MKNFRAALKWFRNSAGGIASRLKRFWRKHKPFRITTYILGALLIINIGIGIYGYNLQNGRPYEFGTSYSVKMARELGIEPRAAFTALLDDLGIRYFRLMSYWDEVESEPGKFDFSELDWQMTEAAKRGAKVSLAIGLRQPRWPECHQPAWAGQLPKDQWHQAIKDFTGVVVNRYKNHPALESYQLENEFFIATFGTCTDYDRTRFVDEYNFVKSLDPDRTIVVNLSNNWYGWPLGEPKSEKYYGISIYKKVWDDRITNNYFEYPLPGWYYAHRAGWIKLFTGRELVAHEFQAEPWGPVPTVNLTSEEQAITMNAGILRERFDYIKQSGIKRVYLWGSEWWYWRLTNFKDPGVWNTVKDEVRSQSISIN